MEKYYNSYDRLFVAHPSFIGEFVDIDGNKFSGTVEGVCIYVAFLGVDKKTKQPRYFINDTGKEYIENEKYNHFFWATIDAENGVLLIPNTEAIREFEEKENLNVACKILEYSIDVVEEGNVGCTPRFVTEVEFKRFVKENFDNFDNSNNYSAQSTAFSYYKVEKEYPRL